jgi:signal transduction histidine kinase
VGLPSYPLVVKADLVRLSQVLSNLLNNAAKYTEEGGLIRLEVAREEGEVVFTVSDNGIGITPEMLPRIFDLFTQVDRSLDRSLGGLGIGLTLVRQLVEMHGGTVHVRSEGPNRGSEFIVRLPAMARPNGAGSPADVALPQVSCGTPEGA